MEEYKKNYNEYFHQCMKSQIFEIITESGVKEFAIQLLGVVPNYFFTIPASTSGKYHPESALGVGGLVRHSINVCKILNYLFELHPEIDDHQKNLLRVAAFFHDCMKCGTDEEYDKHPHTRFNHPVLAANFVVSMSAYFGFDYDDAKFIADAIITHMGKWNTNTNEKWILPTPKTEYQKLLHEADYLASRADINIGGGDMSKRNVRQTKEDREN